MVVGSPPTVRRRQLARQLRAAREEAGWKAEDEAASLCRFEPLVVDGLLQTEAYARALIRKGLVEGTAEEVEDRVTARMTRQQVLTREDNPLRVSFILDEAALHRAVGGPVAMRAQLHRLAEAAELPNVRIQVLPFAAGAHASMMGPFTILEFPETADPAVVYLESEAGDLYVEKQPGVRRYILMFEDLRADALGHDESAALIARMADGFG